MGFGGILAAIAGGFGNGMVKVADEAYKKEAEDRKYQAYKDSLEQEYQLKGKFAEKQFAMDKEKIQLENRGRLAVAAATAMKNNSGNKDLTYGAQALDALNYIHKQLNGDSEKGEGGLYAQYEAVNRDPKQKALANKLAKQIELFKQRSNKILNEPRLNGIVKNNTLGDAFGMKIDQYNLWYARPSTNDAQEKKHR
ncbi:MAG: hypothetical protein Q4A60_03380 [Pasteurellaceae bacterium]|nr:hypothetical protein [Pasteurellaceae bacterium]